MIKLLVIELKKLLAYRAFKILFGIYLLLQIGFLFTGKALFAEEDVQLTEVFNVFDFPNIWNYYLFFACIFNIILGVLFIFITCNEYTYRTIRQNIIDGLGRNEVVLSKILLLLMLGIISGLIVFIACILAGIFYGGETDPGAMLERSGLIMGYLVQCIGVLSMAFFFGTVFKRSGVATLLFLIFMFPLDVIINQAIFKGAINEYTPVSNYFVKIIKSPYLMVRSLGEGAQETVGFTAMAVGIAWIIIFLGSSWLITKKRDL